MEDLNQAMAPAESNSQQFLLERLVLGELTPTQQEKLWGRLEQRGEINRVQQILSSNFEILQKYPAKEVACSIRQRGRSNTVPLRTVLRRLALNAVPALVLLALITLTHDAPEAGAPTRDKGTLFSLGRSDDHSSLYLHRKQGRRVEELRDYSFAEKGDLVQLGYDAAGQRYGVILSVDGRGAVTLHHPQEPNLPLDLRQDGQAVLPFSYELDDAPGCENFFFVSSNASFRLDTVLLAAEQLALDFEGICTQQLDLPAGFTQRSLTVVKEMQ